MERASVAVGGLELPLVVDLAEQPSLEFVYNGATYRYANRGCPIKGHGAVLPKLVRPYLEEGKAVLVVEHGSYYLVFTSE